MKIYFLENELWWCGKVFDGIRMPISSKDTYRIDFASITPNQGAPLLLSNKGRYIWSEAVFTAEFDDGTITIDDRANVRVSHAGSCLADAYRGAVMAHFPFFGQLDPACYQMPIYCTWIEMGYNPTQDKVLAYAKGILENRMPPGILILDDQWMDGYGNWEFHYGRFPNPKQLIDQLHEMGFLVMLWFCPYIIPTGMPFLELQKKDLLVKDQTGAAKMFTWWNGFSALMDLSNPEAVEYLQNKLDRLVNHYGVDGFKFDAGKAEPVTEDLVRHTYLPQNEDCRRYVKLGLRYRLAEYREGWKMGGVPMMMRQQDKHHSWNTEGLLALIPNGMVQSLCGYAYHCPDMVGGGELNSIDSGSQVDQELFVRYAQVCALFPILQFSLLPYKQLDGVYMDCFLEALALRQELLPYLSYRMEHAGKTGEPVVAPLAFYAPEQGLDEITQAFWLGDRYVIWPVVEKGICKMQITLPYGTFRDRTGKKYVSKPDCQSFVVDCDLHTIGVFEKMQEDIT